MTNDAATILADLRRLLPALLLALSLGTPLAHAQDAVGFAYFDAHPIPGSSSGEVPWCLIEGRHLHEYELVGDEEPVYVMDGVIYYVGDSLVRGAPIEAVWYWGAHPLAHVGGAWCVLDGPHSHFWRPWWNSPSWSASRWTVSSGYWTYLGGYDDMYHWSYARWYDRHRGIHVRYIAQPRYSWRYRDSRHPAVVYVDSRRTWPSWDTRQDASRYRSSRTVTVDPRRDSRYGRSRTSSAGRRR